MGSDDSSHDSLQPDGGPGVMDGESGSEQPFLSQVFLAIGVWGLSDTLSLRESWAAVRNDNGRESGGQGGVVDE